MGVVVSENNSADISTIEISLESWAVQLVEYFTLDEIKNELVFPLGLTWDNIRGETLSGTAINLLSYSKRRDLLGDLLSQCQLARPKVNWQSISSPSQVSRGKLSEAVTGPREPDSTRWLSWENIIQRIIIPLLVFLFLLLTIVIFVSGKGFLGAAQSPATLTLSASPNVGGATLFPASETPILLQSPTATIFIDTVTPTKAVTPLSMATQTPSPTTGPGICTMSPGWVIYTIQSGDTLSWLARQTGMTVEEIMEENCLISNTIVTGDLLWLPKLPMTITPNVGVLGATVTIATLGTGTELPTTSPATDTETPPTATLDVTLPPTENTPTETPDLKRGPTPTKTPIP